MLREQWRLLPIGTVLHYRLSFSSTSSLEYLHPEYLSHSFQLLPFLAIICVSHPIQHSYTNDTCSLTPHNQSTFQRREVEVSRHQELLDSTTLPPLALTEISSRSFGASSPHTPPTRPALLAITTRPDRSGALSILLHSLSFKAADLTSALPKVLLK